MWSIKLCYLLKIATCVVNQAVLSTEDSNYVWSIQLCCLLKIAICVINPVVLSTEDSNICDQSSCAIYWMWQHIGGQCYLLKIVIFWTVRICYLLKIETFHNFLTWQESYFIIDYWNNNIDKQVCCILMVATLCIALCRQPSNVAIRIHEWRYLVHYHAWACSHIGYHLILYTNRPMFNLWHLCKHSIFSLLIGNHTSSV